MRKAKAIVARLRRLLGGNGESMPTIYNETPAHNHNHSEKEQAIGETFTSSHASGYAMLYALTSKQHYADLAKQCAQKMLDGAMDRDNRYGYVKPGTELRVGTTMMLLAYAYDLAYDGWDEAFRKKIANELLNYNRQVASGGIATPEVLTGRTGYPPASNHYGSQFGGVAVAMCAILNDPGVDNDKARARIGRSRMAIATLLYPRHG